MPKISLNKERVLQIIGERVSDETLLKEIPFMGTDLEEVTEDSIEVEIFPDRPDLLSEEGFSRYLSSFLNIKKGLTEYHANDSDFKVIVENSVNEVRPFTVCCVVKNLSLSEDKLNNIIEMQEKLHITHGRKRKKVAIGVYPLNKISFPIYYKALDPEKINFKPLDSNIEMSAKDILEKHDKGKEFKHLLDGFSVYPVFLDNKNAFLSMPPVINSEDVGKVTVDTKDVFIECSGSDLKTLNQSLNIVVTSLIDMGGEAFKVNVIYDDKELITPDLSVKELNVDRNWINKWLGLKLNDQEFKDCLESCGLSYENRIVKIPCYRIDFMHQVDVAEEVAIGYKYYNFEGNTKKRHTTAKESFVEQIKSKIRELMIGFGFIENYSYTLISEDFQKSLGSKSIVTLKNSLSETHDSMRVNILSSLLLNLEHNKNNVYPQRIFELGTVFSKNKDVVESESFGSLIIGEDANLTSALQLIDVLNTGLNIDLKLKSEDNPLFISGRSGSIFYKNKKVGFLGEVKPEIISSLDLKFPVSGLELDINFLLDVL